MRLGSKFENPRNVISFISGIIQQNTEINASILDKY